MKDHADTGNHARPPLNMQGQTEIPRTDQDKKNVKTHASSCDPMQDTKEPQADK
jgi:hypothetical protein